MPQIANAALNPAAALLAAAGLVLAGCGGGDDPPAAPPPPPAVSIADAIEKHSSSPQLVRGFLVAARNQPYRFCDSLAESFPPQCGRPALRVDDLELEEISGLEYARGVTWSPNPLKLIGIVRDGALVIEEPHQ